MKPPLEKKRNVEIKQGRHWLGQKGLLLRTYSSKREFLGRLEINHRGIKVFNGSTGQKKILSMYWEKFFQFVEDKNG